MRDSILLKFGEKSYATTSMLDMLWGGVRLVAEVCMVRGRITTSDTQRVLGRCGKCSTAASALAMSARGMCCRLQIDLLLPIVTCIFPIFDYLYEKLLYATFLLYVGSVP
jgi:hypothetical protein